MKHSSSSADYKSRSSHSTTHVEAPLVHKTNTSHRESSVGLKPDICFLVMHVCGRFGGRGKDVRSFTITRCRILKRRQDGKHPEELISSEKEQVDSTNPDSTREVIEQST